MVLSFINRGMTRDDATLVVSKMAQYETIFVNMVVSEDLGLKLTEDRDDEFLADAFSIGWGYLLSGLLPIACLVGFSTLSTEYAYIFAESAGFLALLLLGIYKSSFSGASIVVSAAEATFVGGCCAAIAFGLARVMNSITHNLT